MEDWEDGPSGMETLNLNGNSEPVGRVFMGRGRGFKVHQNSGFSNNGGDNNSGFRTRRDDNDNGGGFRDRKRNDENGEGGFRERRRRDDDDGDGGGKNGGGRGRRQNDDDNDGGGEEKKPPVSYIPPEPTEDENEIYGSGISSGINFDKYDSIPVKVSGTNTVPPILSFEESKLRPFLIDIVKKCGYTKPTPIQRHAIPTIMAGRDVMACAQTGSGKTAAFLLPMINELLANLEPAITDGECSQPQVLIISPTRELTIQIYEEARKFARGSALATCISYGGVAVGHQIRQLLKGCHILVATPGRLNDFLNRGKISFASLKFLVLDEADRMLDMGFKTAIDTMMSHSTMVPKTERQTLMFSATFPKDIQNMAKDYLNNYLFITVGQVGGACSDVEQRFIQVERSDKKAKLLSLLQEIGSERTVVFVETKKQADVVSVVLSERGIPATSIHGDREQRQREEAISDFKRGRMHILVATAVASRGLDIKGIKHVINYDMPKDLDEYVHRIGRTGRVGNRGVATSFYDDKFNSDLAPGLVTLLQQTEQEIPEFLSGSGASFGGDSNNFGGQDMREADNNQTIEAEEW